MQRPGAYDCFAHASSQSQLTRWGGKPRSYSNINEDAASDKGCPRDAEEGPRPPPVRRHRRGCRGGCVRSSCTRPPAVPRAVTRGASGAAHSNGAGGVGSRFINVPSPSLTYVGPARTAGSGAEPVSRAPPKESSFKAVKPCGTTAPGSAGWTHTALSPARVRPAVR